eukprot:SAG25_NODE_54_length_18691_cov_566.202076_6_plen_78_part_00
MQAEVRGCCCRCCVAIASAGGSSPCRSAKQLVAGEDQLASYHSCTTRRPTAATMDNPLHSNAPLLLLYSARNDLPMT